MAGRMTHQERAGQVQEGKGNKHDRQGHCHRCAKRCVAPHACLQLASGSQSHRPSSLDFKMSRLMSALLHQHVRLKPSLEKHVMISSLENIKCSPVQGAQRLHQRSSSHCDDLRPCFALHAMPNNQY